MTTTTWIFLTLAAMLSGAGAVTYWPEIAGFCRALGRWAWPYTASTVWNPSCWDMWYLWQKRDGRIGNVTRITSLGPLGIYWYPRTAPGSSPRTGTGE